MQEMWVQSLGQEDPLEKEMAIQSSILAWKNPMDRGVWRATVHRVAKIGHNLATTPPPPPRLNPGARKLRGILVFTSDFLIFSWVHALLNDPEQHGAG